MNAFTRRLFPRPSLPLSIIAFALIANAAWCDTSIIGRIDGDVHFTVGGSPYVLIGRVTVAEGVTLLIDAGVRVRASSRASLVVDGSLVAEGTTSLPVTFESAADAPRNDDWYGITFTSTGGTVFDDQTNRIGGSILQNVFVRHASAAVTIERTGLVIESSSFLDNGTCILLYGTRHAFIRNCLFDRNGSLIVCPSSPNSVAELYDTRITGNDFRGGGDGRIEIGHPFLTWCEFAFNRVSNPNMRISFAGTVPSDVRTVHIHHNRVSTAANAFMIGVTTSAFEPDASVSHVLFENNIVNAAGERGLRIMSPNDVRVRIRNNTFDDCDLGIELPTGGLRTVVENTFVLCNVDVSLAGNVSLADAQNLVTGNISAYNERQVFSINEGSNVRFANNDLLSFDILSFRNNSTKDVEATATYWAGLSTDDIDESIIDGLDYPGQGRVLYRPVATAGTFAAPVVPPRAVEVQRSSGRTVVHFAPSPDPRVTGYRVWYARDMKGRFTASADVPGSGSQITGPSSRDAIAVTAFAGAAKGDIDQLEGRESVFAYATEGTLAVDVEQTDDDALRVSMVHPNPTNGTSRMSIICPRGAAYSVDVFGMRGERVRMLSVNDATTAVEWDGCDDHGTAVAPGIYAFRVVSGTSVVVRRVMVAR